MNNNDILRRIRYIFDYNDDKMISLFTLGGQEATRSQISEWLKKDDDPDHKVLDDKMMATFLNGLIYDHRGKREGDEIQPEHILNNNIILRKLKIALKLKDDDLLEIFQLADKAISKHEISAFFRHPDQNQYRQCQDQYLRNFLQGLQQKYRKDSKV